MVPLSPVLVYTFIWLLKLLAFICYFYITELLVNINNLLNNSWFLRRRFIISKSLKLVVFKDKASIQKKDLIYITIEKPLFRMAFL
jgi:hypothetical protein